ncbi:MAG: hypothetical protein JJU02_07480 [Cryomorphaceae bacterium]|nr:hypothetical protein [Cryomorphaceae bacterium]
MHRFILCLFIFIGFLPEFLAQNHSIFVGGGLRSDALRDEGYSPLLFDGLGLSALLGYEKKSEKRETLWLLNFSQSRTTNSFGRELKATSVGLLNLNFYPRKENKISWGWSNSNGLQHRFITGFDNFNGRTDVFTSFGPAVKYNLPFTFKNQSFSFQAVSHFQILGFYLPSGYTSSLPKGFGYEPNGALRGFWESLYLFYPGGAFNAALWPKLQWHLSSGNSLSLNYIYEYTRLTGAKLHARSTGMWLMTLSMKLK